MTFFDSALSNTLSVSTLWPQMHYVYQNPTNGEFVACDNRVMLIERNGTPPLFEFYTADGMPANVQGLEYVDYAGKLKSAMNDANLLFVLPVRRSGLFTSIGKLNVLTSDWDKVIEFIGTDNIINIPSFGYKPIYVRNADSSRQALVQPFKRCTSWKLLNTSEELVSVCGSYEEAQEMGELLCGKNQFLIKENME